MPRLMRRRRLVRAAKKKRAGNRLRRFRRDKLNANKQDRATVIEAMEEVINTGYGGSWLNHQLSECPRAYNVSQNFRFYRLKKVEVEFIPYANLYQPGTSFPELYLQVDRTQNVPGGGGISAPVPTKAIMLSRGVLPVKWTSVIKRSYTPSVLRNENFIQNVHGGNVISVASIAATPVKYKWYTTQSQFLGPPGEAASQVEPSWGPQFLKYFGMAYFVDQPIAPSTSLGTIKTKLHWEFRQPMVPTAPSSISDPLATTNVTVH